MTQAQSSYWTDRFATIEEAANEYGQEVYRQIEPAFTKAQRQIQSEIDAWLSRIAVNNQVSLIEARRLLTMKELAEFTWDVNEYIKYGTANAIDPMWLKELENASARFHISRLEAMKIQTQQAVEKAFGNELDSIDLMARRVYTQDYYRSAYEIQKGLGIGWDVAKVDQRYLDKLISKPWAADGKAFSDRIWETKTSMVNELHNELLRNCVLGKSPDQAIKAMTKYVDKKFTDAKVKAGRLVMTEQAFFSSAAQGDCFNELDVEEYEIVATLDLLTSVVCQELDGKHFPMKDYQPGVTAPPFHPWCRTTTVPWFEDNYGGERAARDKDGKTYYVPDNLSYGDWEKTFIDGGTKDTLKNVTEKSILQGVNFTPATTIKGAEEYARSVLGVPNVGYKGVDVTTANEWNRGLKESFKRFPELRQNFGFVGECHERNALIKKDVFEDALRELTKRNPGFSVESLKPHAQKSANQFVRQLSIGGDTMAQSLRAGVVPLLDNFSGVTVNKAYGKSSTDFIEILKNNVLAKFHPKGCDTIRSILDHEIGHQLDDLLSVSSTDEVAILFSNNDLQDALSQYATASKREMVAEAWAEYCNNVEPRETAKIIGELIESKYAKMYGR